MNSLRTGGSALELPSNGWPTGQFAQTHLFIVQLMRQALDDRAFESFRVPTLDTLARLRETGSVARDILSERVHHAAIEAPLRELANSLRTSAKFIPGLPQEHIELFCSKYEKSNLTKNSEVDHCLRECQSLHHMLNSIYSDALEKAICENANERLNRISLRYLVYEYCSNLINSGFSKQFLRYCVNETFFDRTVSRIEKRTLQRFFSKFHRKAKTYRVWMPVNAKGADYLRNIDVEGLTVVKFVDAPSDVRDALTGAGFEATNLVSYRISSLDPYTAAENTRLVIHTVGSVGLLNRKSIEVTWPVRGYVRTERARSGRIIEEDDLKLQVSTKIVRGKTGKAVKRQTHALLTEFNSDSTRRLISTLRTGALARSTTNAQNQLVSLWSAVEVLFGDPPTDLPRIKYYTNQLMPLVCYRYARLYTSAVLDELLLHYGFFIRKLLREVDGEYHSDQYSKFSRLLFEPRYERERKRLMSELSANPLALHKTWKLWDNFRNPQNYYLALSSHMDRVSWQISRIYRARNGLVHNGRTPPYLRALTLNSFEYFRAAVVAILENGIHQDHTSSSRQIISSICFDQDVLVRSLRELGLDDFAFSDRDFERFYFEGKRFRRPSRKKKRK